MIFDGYQSGDEIAWGADSTVYAASKAGEGRDLALKVRAIGEESEGAAFSEGALAQEKAFAAGCKGLVPVFSFGVANSYFHCVSRRYPRSVLSLIQAKASVGPNGLRRLSESVLAALRELQAKQGRPHGNLKSSNIMLEGGPRLGDSAIFLTDLAAKPPNDRAADLHALGRVIYDLVRRREVARFDWPIARSAEWTALGPQAEGWRAFCNILLDPSLGSRPDPLGAAEQALRKLGKGGVLSGKLVPALWVAGGAAVVVGIGFAGFTLIKNFKGSAGSQDESQSAESNDWFTRLAKELNANPSWKSDDPYINERVVDPVRKLRLTKAGIEALAKSSRGAPVSDAEKSAVAEAASAVPAIKEALDNWDAKNSVNGAYDEFSSRGWTLPAASLAKLRGDFSPDRPVLQQLEAVSRAGRIIPEIQLRWRMLEEPISALEKTGDPVLAQAKSFAALEAGQAASLEDLQARLDDIKARFSRITDLLGVVDQSRLKRDGKFANGFTGTATSQVFGQWEEDARRFRPAPEEAARLKAGWDRLFSELDQKIRASGEGKAQLQDALQALRADAGQAASNLLAGDVDRVDKDMRARAAALDQQLGAPPGSVAGPEPMPSPSPSEAGPSPENAGVLGDGEIFQSLLDQLRTSSQTSLTPDSAKALRDKFLTDVRSRTSPAFQSRVGAFTSSLAAIAFKRSASAPTAPPLAGWLGPTATDAGVAYTWGAYKLDFLQIPADGEKPAFFLCGSETPIGLVVDWMNGHGANWSELGIRAGGVVKGPCVWEQRGAGIAVRRDWAWPSSMTSVFPFYAAPPEPPAPLSPINYISSRTASLIAATLGCRLPSVDEWQRAYQTAQAKGWDSPQHNVRDLSWEKQRKYVADCVQKLQARGAALRDPPWPDGDIFVPARLSVQKDQQAKALVDTDDKYLWFAPVSQAAPGRHLYNLVGNVAEYVIEGEASNPRYFVVGGSALSPPEVDPSTPYELSAAQRLRGFSDVGMRVALTAANGAPTDLETFRQLIKSQQPLSADSGR